MFWCMFEQSGTFKNQLKKLGQDAVDLDIKNDFGETDYIVDLFGELDNFNQGLKSVLDQVKADDTVLAFFPCVRFEAQINLRFRGQAHGMDKLSPYLLVRENQRLQSDLFFYISELNKLVLFAIEKKCRLIIENPYGSYTYLRERWCFKPSVVISDRRQFGDYFHKPTGFWFFNGEPYDNVYFECFDMPEPKKYFGSSTVERSMISPQFARYFLRSFVLPPE